MMYNTIETYVSFYYLSTAAVIHVVSASAKDRKDRSSQSESGLQEHFSTPTYLGIMLFTACVRAIWDESIQVRCIVQLGVDLNRWKNGTSVLCQDLFLK